MVRNELKSGIILSYLNLLIGNLIPFFYTPVMLSILGQGENGLYGIANSVMGYISLLNFGIGSAVIRYLSKYRAEKNEEAERRVTGLFLKVYTLIAVLILVVGIFVSFHLDFYGRSLSAHELHKLEILVRLMTVNMAFFLPFSVFSSIIISHERYVFDKAINILTTIGAPVVNLIMLYAGFGSVGLVVSSTIINLLSYGLYTAYVLRKLCVHPSFLPCSPGLLKEILVFSGFAFLGSLVDLLYWATDKLIIGWAVGASAVTVYNIGANFNSYLTGLSTAISGILTPKISAIVTKNQSQKELSDLFIRVGRLQFLIVSFIVSAFVVFGRWFLEIWLGSGYELAYPVALLTMIPVSIPLIQNTGLNILYVTNKHRFRSIVYLGIAILNIVLTFIWVESYGIVGAAAATGLAYVIGNIFIINWYYYRYVGLDIPLFWKNILRMLPQVIFFIVAGLYIVPQIGVHSWCAFLASSVIYTIFYYVCAYRVMMNQYERDLFAEILMKIFNKIKR